MLRCGERTAHSPPAVDVHTDGDVCHTMTMMTTAGEPCQRGVEGWRLLDGRHCSDHGTGQHHHNGLVLVIRGRGGDSAAGTTTMTAVGGRRFRRRLPPVGGKKEREGAPWEVGGPDGKRSGERVTSRHLVTIDIPNSGAATRTLTSIPRMAGPTSFPEFEKAEAGEKRPQRWD